MQVVPTEKQLKNETPRRVIIKYYLSPETEVMSEGYKRYRGGQISACQQQIYLPASSKFIFLAAAELSALQHQTHPPASSNCIHLPASDLSASKQQLDLVVRHPQAVCDQNSDSLQIRTKPVSPSTPLNTGAALPCILVRTSKKGASVRKPLPTLTPSGFQHPFKQVRHS